MLAKRGRHHKAAVAVARKLAVIMHALWSDETSTSAIRLQAKQMFRRGRRSRTASFWAPTHDRKEDRRNAAVRQNGGRDLNTELRFGG